MARRKKKSPAPGVTVLGDGRFKVRAAVTCQRTGRRKDHARTLPQGTTLGQAIDARAALISQLSAGSSPTQTRRVPRVEDYAADWIEGRRVKASTRRVYTSHIAHLSAELGHLRLDEVTRADLSDFAGVLESCGLKIRSQKTVWVTCLSCLRDGWADFGLEDPSARVKAPSSGKTAPPAGRALSESELAKFCGELEMCDPLARVSLLMVALTGLRRSEVAAARRDCLDLEEGWYTVPDSKTAAGLRRVPLAQALCDALANWLDEAPSSEWVFPGRKGHIGPEWIYEQCLKVAVAAKLGHVTPHDLRRTLITLMDRAGMDRLAVRALAGHTSNVVTDRYSRVSDEDRRRLLTLVEEVG